MKTEKIGPSSLSKFVFYVTANLPGRLRDRPQNVKFSIFCRFGRDKTTKIVKLTQIFYDSVIFLHNIPVKINVPPEPSRASTLQITSLIRA